VGVARFDFTPAEAPKPSRMTLTLVALDRPTPDFAAVFTRNAFPGAPIVVGRGRLGQPALSAIIVNNKISNVCAPGGVAASERVCAETARLLGVAPTAILPSSTGVIGWGLPVDAIVGSLPAAVGALAAGSIMPAAEGIVTTDLYPKVRRCSVGGGSIVGIAKGAGMIEPNMATMLVYLLTDLAVPRAELRRILAEAVEPSFNSISIDSDTSTSDTVALVSSGRVPCPDAGAFARALRSVCADLAEDVVRNGEGVRHVIRVTVVNAPDFASARALGKAVVNAPLFKCAVAGNDPNVGRLVQAIGKHVGTQAEGGDLSRMRMTLGGVEIFADGAFRLDPSKEAALVAHMRGAELYASAPPVNGVFSAPVDFPAHERCVEIGVDLGGPGKASAVVLGADLTHEYVSENADYRS
jgi:glutamate N-acetyltransferase/amino-acid N-acetyltransferase